LAVEKEDILTALRAAFPGAVLETSAPAGEPVVVLRPEAVLEVMTFLRAEPRGYTMLLDLACVDYPDRPLRFEVVYHLYSLAENRRLRLKTALPAESPAVASLTPLWKNANWLEREAFDMFGVRFDGHPDLRRLFMYEGFEGHPLRKDYPLRKRQPRIPMRPGP
jgi:NADH-quinone oxidoreductase subunit C